MDPVCTKWWTTGSLIAAMRGSWWLQLMIADDWMIIAGCWGAADDCDYSMEDVLQQVLLWMFAVYVSDFCIETWPRWPVEHESGGRISFSMIILYIITYCNVVQIISEGLHRVSSCQFPEISMVGLSGITASLDALWEDDHGCWEVRLDGDFVKWNSGDGNMTGTCQMLLYVNVGIRWYGCWCNT